MKYFYLVWKSLWRKKIRTILTILSVAVAFLLFGLLSGLNQVFSGVSDIANAQRLVTLDKISIINSLPAAYLQRIESVSGVNRASHMPAGSAAITRTRGRGSSRSFRSTPKATSMSTPNCLFPTNSARNGCAGETAWWSDAGW